MKDWHPIATAPKDGSEIIVQLPGGEARAFWCDDLKAWILSQPIHMERPHGATGWRPLAHKRRLD
jgi:hypothetical protein